MTPSSNNSRDTGTPSKAQRPRDAATLVLVDTSTDEPRLLMGKRRATQVFMPNKVVFPGGRVDEDDRIVESADELSDNELAKILLQMKGHPSTARARSMALAAVRETFEETGVGKGRPLTATPQAPPAGWHAIFCERMPPAPGAHSQFCRAKNPPVPPPPDDTP